jgi:hypothetical protein
MADSEAVTLRHRDANHHCHVNPVLDSDDVGRLVNMREWLSPKCNEHCSKPAVVRLYLLVNRVFHNGL